MRPRIGISTYWRTASFGPWTDMPAAMVPQGYVDAVAAAGGTPLLVPPAAEIAADPSPVLDVIDGLVLVGGEDIDPAAYGAEREAGTDRPNARRDAAELALLRGALERDLPLLAICRGAQLLNVAFGGDLVQEVGDHLDPALHRPVPGTFGRHDVSLEGGHVRGLAGERLRGVHSHHHQGFDRIGEGLAVTGHAADGSVEALEDPGRSFCVGVLWHPEEAPFGDGASLFRGLVEAARRRQLDGVALRTSSTTSL
jgi:putative glutamine amidotransferase